VTTAVVVDTMIASAWLGLKHSQRKARWAPILEPAVWVLPFTVVAEMRFGAEVAGWGARRRGVLDRLIGRAGVVPPIDEVTDAYVDLRTWCVRSGHGLGAKDHEADRWVAAVAIAGRLPLATDDSIFDDVPALHRVDPDGTPDEN
jgi:predicted nucleic acid-binding protein